MVEDLEKRIIGQLEYYFGDYNLPRDKFLKEKIQEDDGWVSLDVLLSFKRLAILSTDKNVIATAVQQSSADGLLEANEDKSKIRRKADKPIPELNDERKRELSGRTAYAKGFPPTAELSEILQFLEQYGPVVSCYRRTAKNRTFKGSCFITFETQELCEKFLAIPEIKYTADGTVLERHLQNDYFKLKREAIQERIKAQKEKKQAKLNEGRKILDIPNGTVLHFSGIPEGKTLTREEIKDKIQQTENVKVCYIDFNKGDSEGYIRLSGADSAVGYMKSVEDGEVTVSDVPLKVRVLDGDEEKVFLEKTVDAVMAVRNRKRQHSNNQTNRKRKNTGGRDGGGGDGENGKADNEVKRMKSGENNDDDDDNSAAKENTDNGDDDDDDK